MRAPRSRPALSRLLFGVLGVVFAVAAAGIVLAPGLTAGAGGSPFPGASQLLAQASPTAVPTPSPTARPTAMPAPTPILAPTASPTPEPTATPVPTPKPTPKLRLDPPPKKGPFEIDLSRKNDFVSQANKIYCVPGSMQTMMNIIDKGANRNPKLQDRLYRIARRLSTHRLRGDGTEPEGWARGLNRLGYGPYKVSVADTRGAAIRRAAKALRMTGKPVGLLVWRGAHAWVMSGFKATADPAYSKKFEVTHVYIEDVWYPRVSSIWGPSRPPGSLVPVGRLDEDYIKWRRPTGPYPGKDGRYVLVLPIRSDA